MTSTVEVKGSGNTAVAVRTWPAPADPKGTVIIVHGVGDHSGRYEHVGAELTGAGYRVVSFDLPGHGASGGPRAHVKTDDQLLDAVDDSLAEVSAGGRVVLYGHSLGGQIALSYVFDGRPLPDLLVLSAPALDAFYPQWQRRLVTAVAKVLPNVAIPNQLEGVQLSRDPKVGEAYFADPLVVHRATLAFGAAWLGSIRHLQAGLRPPPVPTYVFHGGADTIVPARFSAPLGELEGVTRRLWPALRHETHNEPEWRDVIGEVVAWLDST